MFCDDTDESVCPELNLFSAVDSPINKNPNLSDLWSLDAIGINDPV